MSDLELRIIACEAAIDQLGGGPVLRREYDRAKVRAARGERAPAVETSDDAPPASGGEQQAGGDAPSDPPVAPPASNPAPKSRGKRGKQVEAPAPSDPPATE